MGFQMALVDILLASYNGERYIEAQLLSLICQSFRDWRLLVHDDGSTDATIEVIKKWNLIDSRIQLIEDDVICGGAAKNFMHLIKRANADYVMFCDQDDIWFDNKIEIMLNSIQKKQKNIPQIVYSGGYVWKPKHGISGKIPLVTPKKIEQLLFLNGGQNGCTAIFNRAMCIVLSKWERDLAMHDHLLHLAGLSLGEVEYVSLPLMLYRQHENTVTSETVTSARDIKGIIRRSMNAVVYKKHYDTIQNFYCFYKNIIRPHSLRKIEIFLKLPQLKKIHRLMVIWREQYQLLNTRVRLLIKILVRPYIA